MSLISKGNAIVVAKDHLNADTAMGWYLGMDSLPAEEITKQFFSGFDPEIAKTVKSGDILVCGRNFGYGKVHGAFFTAMKMIGLECIVAESISTQMIQIGLMQGIYFVECPGILKSVQSGDEIEVDVEKAVIKNITRNTMIQGRPFPPFLVEVMNDGGQMGHLLTKIADRT